MCVCVCNMCTGTQRLNDDISSPRAGLTWLLPTYELRNQTQALQEQ